MVELDLFVSTSFPHNNYFARLVLVYSIMSKTIGTNDKAPTNCNQKCAKRVQL